MTSCFFSWLTVVAATLVVAPDTEAFARSSGALLPPGKGRRRRTSLHLQRPIAERHFQLEELEDAEMSTTDVVLNADQTVTLGGTNGPLYVASHGTWCSVPVREDAPRRFEMNVTRTFATGADGGETTNLGAFEYSVGRTYRGECSLVGGSIFAMNGDMMDVDDIFGERKVGFFNMIDTSEERERNAMQ